MSNREAQSAPTQEEAFAALTQLAQIFLQTGPRTPGGATTSSDTADAPMATLLLDESGTIKGIDEHAERLLSRSAAELIGSSAHALFGKLPVRSEALLCHIRRPDGNDRAVWARRSQLTLEHGAFTAISLHEHDPVGGRRTELRYRHLVEQIPAVVFTAALDGGLFDIYVSPQIENLLGFSQTQWVADPVLWYERLHLEDRPKLDQEFARGCATGGPFKADCRFLTRDNRIVWVHGEARLIRDAHGLPLLLQGVAFDITETKRAEEVARASLREKETLLKEIHHRVKNNLQVTSSLLKLQADGIEGEAARRALREGQGRIRSMALVHELLYRSKDLSMVDLGDYIHELTRQLLRSHAVNPSQVRVETKLIPIPLPIDVAVPCGLILNELVSNALKHAFVGERRGTITIELRRDHTFDELAVRDDGVGMGDKVDVRASTTLGLRLIQTLADQIDGRLTVHSNGGTEVRLQLPKRQEERA